LLFQPLKEVQLETDDNGPTITLRIRISRNGSRQCQSGANAGEKAGKRGEIIEHAKFCVIA
jgi:hypothetical protein